MKKKLLLGLLIICLVLTGCGKKEPVFEEITYNEEEQKAYTAYNEKETPTPDETTKENYKEILKDRFGIDISEIGNKGFELEKVNGETFYESEYITLSYKKPNEKYEDQDIFLKSSFNITKSAGNGTVYKENDGNLISEEKIDEKSIWYYSGWFYIWEGRTYKTLPYISTEDDISTYELTFTLEKKYTQGNTKNVEVVSEDNYAKLLKDYFGIDPVFNDDWKLSVVTTSGEFKGKFLSYNVEGIVDEDDYEVYYDEEEETYVDDPSTAHTEEEWNKLALELVRKYFDKTAKISKKGNFEADYDSEEYKLNKGKKIKNSKSIKFDKEGKCSWVYYYKNKLIWISFDHYADSVISITFSNNDD